MSQMNLTGHRLGKYELRAEIGRGGMGTVYLGHDPMLERPVAVKSSSISPPGSLGFRVVMVLDSSTCWGCHAKNPNKFRTPIRYPCELPEPSLH